MAILSLDSYYIHTVKWKERGKSYTYRQSATFARTEEEQNEAFETIQEMLGDMNEEPEGDGSTGKMKIPSAGPRRIEAELVMKLSPLVKKYIVVLGVTPSHGASQGRTLMGRVRLSSGEIEKHKSYGIPGSCWAITKISVYPGGFTTPAIVHYSMSDEEKQHNAWHKLENFLETTRPVEMKVVEEWVPDLEDDDDFSPYGGRHFTQRSPQHYLNHSTSPSTYKPPVASVRLCGDDVGKGIHLSTCERDVARTAEERALSLEEHLQKKDEAETTAEDEKVGTEISAAVDASDISTDRDNGNHSGHSGTHCSCDSPACGICNGELDSLDALRWMADRRNHRPSH